VAEGKGKEKGEVDAFFIKTNPMNDEPGSED
jgi:hypothetical protein